MPLRLINDILIDDELSIEDYSCVIDELDIDDNNNYLESCRVMDAINEVLADRRPTLA